MFHLLGLMVENDELKFQVINMMQTMEQCLYQAAVMAANAEPYISYVCAKGI